MKEVLIVVLAIVMLPLIMLATLLTPGALWNQGTHYNPATDPVPGEAQSLADARMERNGETAEDGSIYSFEQKIYDREVEIAIAVSGPLMDSKKDAIKEIKQRAADEGANKSLTIKNTIDCTVIGASSVGDINLGSGFDTGEGETAIDEDFMDLYDDEAADPEASRAGGYLSDGVTTIFSSRDVSGVTYDVTYLAMYDVDMITAAYSIKEMQMIQTKYGEEPTMGQITVFTLSQMISTAISQIPVIGNIYDFMMLKASEVAQYFVNIDYQKKVRDFAADLKDASDGFYVVVYETNPEGGITFIDEDTGKTILRPSIYFKDISNSAWEDMYEEEEIAFIEDTYKSGGRTPKYADIIREMADNNYKTFYGDNVVLVGVASVTPYYAHQSYNTSEESLYLWYDAYTDEDGVDHEGYRYSEWIKIWETLFPPLIRIVNNNFVMPGGITGGTFVGGVLVGDMKNGWMWPVADHSNITSGVGPRWGRTHFGLDIGIPTGTTVYAAKDGVITWAGWYNENIKYAQAGPGLEDPGAGYGLYIIITHADGTISKYAHLSVIGVSSGHVTAGQAIGLSGDTGYRSGPHLHFEIRDPQGRIVDPELYLP